MAIKNGKGLHTYSFQTDLVVEASTRDAAEALLRQRLDEAGLDRYRIGKGTLIGFSLLPDTDAPAASGAATVPAAPVPTPGQPADGLRDLALDLIRRCVDDGRLVRLSINRGKGVRLSVPCRILRWDEPSSLLTVYHVDEKQVYTFGIGEIDDFLL
ncbi:hypothetical protein NYE40_17805 [Paenibacillus sp. FSL W8-1187]|uniref:Uncharacterized protein n=1 Tax=Paenibacillus pasadenensis TaxID=217090 RepID=A0A2N5N9S3_9BACL|nr:hypothetical protein [Paenibacillus pasadenensis]PLT47106.1 hypothetical protein B8V81_1330 [Paenibacillus pasadenensis]